MASRASTGVTPSPKQLVFVFMTATSVAVVVFLCGVLVGRGVPAAPPADAGALAERAADPGGEDFSPPADPGPGSAPGARVEALTYHRRLESREPLAETLPAPAPPSPVSEPAPPSPPPGAGGAATEAPAGSLPGAAGDLTVQVAALRGRAEAMTIVEYLVGKGYPAYLVSPAPDAPVAVFRVRVGRYASRRQAEDVVRRLEAEEQFKPWITR